MHCPAGGCEARPLPLSHTAEEEEEEQELDVNLNVGVKSSRWGYAQLHVQAMGVTGQPTLEQPDGDNNLRQEEALPEGWERHLDDDGAYYWHIRTGTIQRERPPPGDAGGDRRPSPPAQTSPPAAPSSPPSGAQEGEGRLLFSVRSLGWSEVPAAELSPERSSRALNRCIVALSQGRGVDGVGRWGEGRPLLLQLDPAQLCLLRPHDGGLLHRQPLHAIRVWGVGRDNGRERDFAYVARDPGSRRFMCHVFRCDMPARIIANALRDVCKRMVLERSLSDPAGGGQERPAPPAATRRLASLSLGEEEEEEEEGGPIILRPAMEEPRKVLGALYLGSVPVAAAAGMDLLNGAIDALLDRVPRAHWLPVQVSVAPSTVTVTLEAAGGGGQVLAECRVRFLSFLGIGREVTHCGFVMHTAQDRFVAHVFHCEPSAGALCKTIEAACKLRYQKCLDAHRQAAPHPSAPATPPPAAKVLSLKGVLGSLVGRAMGAVQHQAS